MAANTTMSSTHYHGRLATIVASRLVLNAIFRIAYPLIPVIAARFNVPDHAATWIVTIQVLLGMCSPFGGWLGDRVGYRRTMLMGATLSLLGTLGIAIAPSLTAMIIAYGVCGFGVALYQPSVQAYISVITPYHQRGRAVGLVELSWAVAGFAAVPPLMWLVERQGALSGAFLVLAACLAAAIVATLFALPEARPMVSSTSSAVPGTWRVVLNNSVLGLLAFVLLGLAANELVFIVQPTWAAARFGASPVDLGTALLVFGLGELGGSSTSTLFTDRLGKRRSTALGFVLAAALYLLLPVLSVNWLSYLVCYFLYGFAVEFGIVSMLTFATTVSLHARATVMALTITSMQLGRTIASRRGVAIFEASSLGANGAIAAVMTLIGVVIMLRFVREAEHGTAHDPV